MPTLGVYIGELETYFVLRTDNGELKYTSFPYTFSSNLYSHFITETQFYSEMLSKVCNSFGEDIKDCEVAVTSFPGVPSGFPENSFQCSLEKIILDNKDTNHIFLDLYTIISGASYISSFPYQNSDIDLDFYSNMSIYGHPIPYTEKDFQEIDYFLKLRFIKNNFKLISGKKPTVFSGGRFTWHYKNTLASYMTILDVLRSQGIYNVKLDVHNSLVLNGLLNKYKPEYNIAVSNSFTNLGAVVSTTGDVECLVESEFGTSQLLDVKADSIFILPLDNATKARIVIKNDKLGQKEHFIEGGELGLVIDTRNTIGLDSINVQNTLKWQQVIKQAKGGL